jgi:peptidoglycan/LPS O-acetylase OafA/YrhL
MSLAWLKVTPPEGEPRFRFVDAVRTLSILWILLLHVLFYCTFFVSPDASAAMVQNWPARLATRGHFGLDALFVITGFLIGYYVLVDVDRGRFSFWPWLFRRMMRIIPAYFAVLVVYHFTMNFNFEYVWSNVLFVNNYIPLMHQAMGWSWSLPIDVAFYLTFPLLLIVVRDRPRHLFTALWFVFLGLLVVRGAVELHDRFTLPLPFDPAHHPAEFERYFNDMYDKTHNRIGAIVCGVMVVVLVRYHGAEKWLAVRPGVSTILAVLAAAIVGVDLFTPMFAGEGAVPDPSFTIVYLICYNYAFAFAVAILMLLMLAPPPALRWLQRALSARAWFVPAELSYSVFLLNPLVILGLYRYVIRTPQAGVGPFAVYALSAVTCSFALAYVLYLAVERPCREWAKNVVRPRDAARGARTKQPIASEQVVP